MCDRFLLLLLLLLLLVLLRFCLLGWLFDYQTTPLPYHRCILGVRGGGFCAPAIVSSLLWVLVLS